MRSKRSRSASRAVSATASGMVGEARGHRLPAWPARARGCRAAAARRRRASCARGPRRTRPAAARAPRACAWTLPVATHGDAEPRGQRGQAAVARAVVARERALQLDAQARRARRRRAAGASSARRATPLRARSRSGRRAPRRARSTSSSATRAARRDRAGLAPVARVRVRAREQPAEVAPAARVAHEQREVAAVARASTSAPWIARRPSACAACANSIEPDTESWSVSASAPWPQLERGRHELLGQRGAVEEREGGVACSSTYGHANTCSHALLPTTTRGQILQSSTVLDCKI